MIEDDRIYTLAEISRTLRVSTVTLSRAIHSQKLKAIRVGGQWRVFGSELTRYVENETRNALGRPPEETP